MRADSAWRRNWITETSYAPINRSAYRLAAEATDAFEAARAKVAGFVNAGHADEIVFTKNATEALNVVAQAWGRANLGAGDVVVLTHMEHHANVVTWHMIAAERGIELRWIPLTDDGRLLRGGGRVEVHDRLAVHGAGQQGEVGLHDGRVERVGGDQRHAS